MTRRIPSLDTLRAAAVSWVILRHLRGAHIVEGLPWPLQRVVDGGNLGVDLFFVLSGTLIGGILLRELESTGSLDVPRFWTRRWLRTLPAYAAMLLLEAIASHGRWDHPWAYVVFLQNYLSIGSRFGWSWSLCVEEHFYLALPLLVVGLRHLAPHMKPRTVLRALAIAAILEAFVARELVAHQVNVFSDWDTMKETIYCPTHMRLDGLGAGLLVATLPPFELSTRLVALLAMPAGAIVALRVFGGQPHVQDSFWMALAFATITVAALRHAAWREARVPLAPWLADVSYSLYLVHPAVFAVVHRLPLAIAVAFAAAAAMRRFVERPALALRERLALSRAAPPEETA